jgi:beta-lactam-binding protein with PASTA domain
MKRFLRGLGIFLGLVGVGVISAVAVVALLLRQEEVRVPDLTGQDIVTVVETLNQQGLQLKIERRESSLAVPRDAVISQTPGPGNGIKKGRQVHVVVSLGPSESQTPALIGEHFRKADILIRQAGFFPGNLSRVSSETVERDTVIAQNPQPGSSLDKSGKISLLISSGKRLEPLVMPALTGKKPQEAVTIVERLGLQYRLLYKQNDAQPAAERIVIQQKPAAGWPIQPDGTVDIVVNK